MQHEMIDDFGNKLTYEYSQLEGFTNKYMHIWVNDALITLDPSTLTDLCCQLKNNEYQIASVRNQDQIITVFNNQDLCSIDIVDNDKLHSVSLTKQQIDTMFADFKAFIIQCI